MQLDIEMSSLTFQTILVHLCILSVYLSSGCLDWNMHCTEIHEKMIKSCTITATSFLSKCFWPNDPSKVLCNVLKPQPEVCYPASLQMSTLPPYLVIWCDPQTLLGCRPEVRNLRF